MSYFVQRDSSYSLAFIKQKPKKTQNQTHT